jgi:hypothetical protein
MDGTAPLNFRVGLGDGLRGQMLREHKVLLLGQTIAPRIPAFSDLLSDLVKKERS